MNFGDCIILCKDSSNILSEYLPQYWLSSMIELESSLGVVQEVSRIARALYLSVYPLLFLSVSHVVFSARFVCVCREETQ